MKKQKKTIEKITDYFLITSLLSVFPFMFRPNLINLITWRLWMFFSILVSIFLILGIILKLLYQSNWIHGYSKIGMIATIVIFMIVLSFLQPINAIKDLFKGPLHYVGNCSHKTTTKYKSSTYCYINIFEKKSKFQINAADSICTKLNHLQKISYIYPPDPSTIQCPMNIDILYLYNSKVLLSFQGTR